MGNPFSNLEDEKLMELYKSGESMAFEVIYSRHKSRVYTYLYKRVSNKELVDDIFQSTFAKFHKSRHLYNSEYPLLKWLYTISKSVLLDSFKKNKMAFVELEEKHMPINDDIYESPIDIDSENNLSQNEKDALKLRYYSDQDFDEISKVLNTSEANSRKLVSRAIKKLKTKFQGDKNE
tara:strand:- start:256781 stop:257314 length:534 start_codon:yes stop_codon:yes gene_type:complete